MIYELSPIDGRKSFYSKARVEIDNQGNETLYSYNTKILTITASGEYVKHWNGWTAITGRHIKAFSGLNKKEFLNLPFVSLEG